MENSKKRVSKTPIGKPKRWTPPPLMAPDEKPPTIQLFGAPVQPQAADPNYKYDIRSAHAMDLGGSDIKETAERCTQDLDSVDHSWLTRREERRDEKYKDIDKVPNFNGDPEREKRLKEYGYVPPPYVAVFGLADPDQELWDNQVREDHIREEREKLKSMVAETKKKRRHSPSLPIDNKRTRREPSASPEIPDERFVPFTDHIIPEYEYDRDTTPFSHGIYLDSKDPLNRELAKNEHILPEKLVAAIRQEMEKNGISMSEFAKNVIDRREDTFSEMMNFPSPWDETVKTWKESYLRMYRWLDMPMPQLVNFAKGIIPMPEAPVVPVIEIVAAVQAVAAVPAVAATQAVAAVPAVAEVVNVAPVVEVAKVVEVAAPPPTFKEPSAPAKKKGRLEFTEEQKAILGAAFKKNSRPGLAVYEQLANQLGLQTNSISNFFMNRRRRGLK